MQLEYFDQLYQTSELMPHGECLIWTPGLLWSHVGADIVTGIAYYLITGLICYFIYKRRDIPFSTIFVLFGAFVMSCGTTHFMSAWTIYYPSYWAEGVINVINALVSIFTAFLIIPLMPRIIALPSLKETNEALVEENKRRKRAEASLRESQESYRMFVEGTNNLMTNVDKGGHFIFVNHIGEIILGKEKSALIGSRAFDFVHPEDRDSTEQWFRDCVGRKVSQASFENRLVNSSTGETFHFLWTVSFYYDDQGELEYANGIAHNITERKQREEEAKRNELRLKRLVDLLQHPSESTQDFLDYALEQVIALTESEIGYIYHYHDERKEFGLNSWSKGVLPNCAVAEKQTCHELDKTGIWGEAVRQRRPLIVNDFQADHPLKKGYPEGHVRLVNFMTVPIFQGKDIVGVVGVANKKSDYDEIDILQVSLLMEAVWKVTDRMKAEEALAASENRYAMTIAAVNDGLWDWNVQSGEALFSPLYYSILGYEDQEFPASYASWRLLVHPDDIDPVEHELQESVNNGRGFNIDLRMRMKSGEWLWVCTRGKTVEYDAEGKVLRMVGTLSDITERKREEKEKAKLQIQLNQAQKMESIGVLAGGIAHDFNNILGAILGYAEMARDDAEPSSRVVYDLDRVVISAHRAKELVKQILAFSRQATVDRIPINIQPLVKESLKMLRASIPATISITEDIHPLSGTVLADPSQIHQIVMNLCTNAYHAMEMTGGELSVKLHDIVIAASESMDSRELPPGEYVELTVSDSGTGIGPDIIDKIFDPYFTTKAIGKGTGMGLSITHGILKSYGGAITVESTLGQGATFHVYIPVISAADVQHDEESQEAPKGKGHILFVDDEELLLEMGHSMLERLGYTVTSRSSSLEALETFMNDPDHFDLLITDQTMLGMTGMDLSRRILQISPNMPIIICTGYSNLVNEESAKAIGIREFALKPFTKASIGKLVSTVLDAGAAEERSVP